MRIIALICLALLGCANAFARPVSMRTITENNTTAYIIEAGAFRHQSNANAFREELSTWVKAPVSVEQPEINGLYFVRIGPVTELEQAKSLQARLTKNTPMAPKFLESSTAANGKSIPPVVSPGATAVDSAMNTGNTAPVDDETPEATADAAGRLWNLRNADIRAVIAEVSRITGKNFVIDPRVQGKVSIVSSTPMSGRELYQVFLSTLQVSGFAAVPSGRVIKIVPNMEAKTMSPDMLSQMRERPIGDAMMTEVVPVHYVPAEQLVPVLRPLMPQWSNVSAYAPSNMLILSGRASNIRQLSEIIRQVDSSSANGIDVVRLQHALAMDIANTLKDLVKAQPGTGGRSQVMLAADDRSNSILLSGSKTDRIRLRILIAQLDRNDGGASNSTTQVVYLSFLRAEDLVPILAGIAQANFSGVVGTTIGTITTPQLDSTNPASSIANNNQASNMGGMSSGSSQASGTTSAPFSALGNGAGSGNTTGVSTQNEGSTKPTIQIIAEPNTNSIILNAPATLIRTLKSVISQLDIRPAQLLIEALVAEVDESDVVSLGIEWGTNSQTGKAADFRPGFAIINSKTALSDFQAQIYALARERKANILSTPSVVVLDNRQAKILVGKQVSVASTSYPNNAGGTTTASPFTTFDRVNVALHLYVRPQITRGKGISLQIDQGNDTLDPPNTVITGDNPTFKISSIVTSVHVDSGDVVVLGGLAQDTLANDDTNFPILSDIPGLGRLFQHNIRAREKKVLMVFIRPVILRSEADTLEVSGAKYAQTRNTQLDFVREQVFNQNNKDSVLPNLQDAKLPRPFGPPPPQPPVGLKPFPVTK